MNDNISIDEIEKVLEYLRIRDNECTWIEVKEEQIDEINGYQGKDESINPAHDEACWTFSVFPPLPFNLLRDIDIVNKRHHNQSPPAANPEER